MPLTTNVKFDPLLTNISVQFQPAPDGYLADLVAPPVPVAIESAQFWVYDRSRFDIPDSKRKPRSEYRRIDWSVTSDTYLTEQYGLEGEIDDDERRNTASPLDLDIDTTEIVTDMVLNNREKRVAAMATSPSSIPQGVSLASGDRWNEDGSNVLGDVATARLTIFGNTGMRPNKALIGHEVLEALKRNAEIKEIIKYTERAIVTRQLLATVFEVDEVLVGGVFRRTSMMGQADTLADVWGNVALFFYSEPRPSLKKPSFMYQMREVDLRVFRYREDKRDTDIIRVSEKQDEKIITPELGYLILTAVDQGLWGPS